MKEKILKNWPYMLLSFILAFVLWFVVVQVTDPQTTKTFNIPVEFVNEDVITEKGMVVEIVGETTASIEVTKARSVVNSLSESDFSAVADYSKMYSDTQVPITITVKNSKIKSTEFEQKDFSIEVKLEKLQTVTRVIEYELIGTPSTGYVVNSVSLNPESVTITCPESMVPYMRTAKVYIDVTDITDSTDVSAQLKLFDGNQDEIDVDSLDHVSWDTNGVIECIVEVYQVQSIPVIVAVSDGDKVAEGYEYTGYSLSAENVKLYGSREQLSEITSIYLPSVSLKDASENVVKEIDIQSLLPDGVSVYKDNTSVTVTFNIEKLETKILNLKTNALKITGLAAGMEAKFATDEVAVKIQGLAANLEAVTASDINGLVNLSNLEEGETEIEPVFTKTSGNFEIVEVEKIMVSINEIETTTEEATTSHATEATETTQAPEKTTN